MQPPALKTGDPCLESPGSRGREIARDYARVRWGTGHFSKFQLETLFYIFYAVRGLPLGRLPRPACETLPSLGCVFRAHVSV